ncbi:MAG: hypothetical protein EXS10_07400 [Phycisphaerales bacterium]|nr:hypothetical protein [Phycisphaerales bacterium]
MNAQTETLLRAAIEHPRAFLAPIILHPHELSQTVAHANNVAMAAWIDRLAELHADAHGCSRELQARQGRVWFVARHEVDYLGEAFLGDDLYGATWIESMGRTTLMRRTSVFRISAAAIAPKLLLSASTRWAYVDLASRKPVAMPTEWRLWLDPLR